LSWIETSGMPLTRGNRKLTSDFCQYSATWGLGCNNLHKQTKEMEKKELTNIMEERMIAKLMEKKNQHQTVKKQQQGLQEDLQNSSLPPKDPAPLPD
jgi:hypothetical protein